MKAIQFIKEFGFQKAKALCEGAPEGATVYDIDNNEYADTREDTFGLSCNLIGLRSLGRLVVSLDQITRLGGLPRAKDHLNYLISYGSEFGNVSRQAVNDLQSAIKDHESLYGANHG
ncbi:hypothetical protein [Acinetobacter baumannii]|uniref:hypothetical protein n=1 Tax=Acinetobacter baumannii TaxID=470 RepID=UPI00104FD86D|nr:hypothetical protein [Acinetobacter baumannii]ELA8525363.1 hypothetical protein [Acinetobacter baumannii]EME0362753.1 hypothetical protein [Acinetobacter baumannii]EME0365256.1 hypothetical protein [Acinetobacter baumannii]MBF6924344.1 hypothetical protein [Acinetobacter baumannii]MBF6937044.1 hypothetical protein [Acinetobacter baumannii]